MFFITLLGTVRGLFGGPFSTLTDCWLELPFKVTMNSVLFTWVLAIANSERDFLLPQRGKVEPTSGRKESPLVSLALPTPNGVPPILPFIVPLFSVFLALKNTMSI